MTGFSETLAGWVRADLSFSDPVAEIVRLSYIDTVACMAAGSGGQAVDAVIASGAALSSGRIPVAGRKQRLGLDWAALANGAAAHVLDYDDNLEPALGHASAVLVPALLSSACHFSGTGQDLIEAYIVGIEVMSRLGLAMNMRHYDTGWHSTSTLGAPAAAAAVAKLLRLSSEQTLHAISIASSMAGGSKIQFGTTTKHLHAGLAARAGIASAMLARCGARGAREAIEGAWGMHGLMQGNSNGGMAAALEGLGSELMITRYGLMRKLYPCCAAAHRAIDGAIEFSREFAPSHPSVERIEIRLAKIQVQNLRYENPRTPHEARFSLHYCFASALLDGRLGPEAFTPDALERSDVRRLSTRIDMLEDPDLHGNLPPDAVTPATITVRLSDGSIHKKRIDFQRGHGLNPLSETEVRQKFLALVGPVLGGPRSEKLYRCLGNIERLDRAADILELARA